MLLYIMASPRERMVISTALLIRERGAHSTAISDVLEHSGAPRGSAYHYFPGGRTQLLCEAVDYRRRVHRGPDGEAADAVVDAIDVIVDGIPHAADRDPTTAQAARWWPSPSRRTTSR